MVIGSIVTTYPINPYYVLLNKLYSYLGNNNKVCVYTKTKKKISRAREILEQKV